MTRILILMAMCSLAACSNESAAAPGDGDPSGEVPGGGDTGGGDIGGGDTGGGDIGGGDTGGGDTGGGDTGGGDIGGGDTGGGDTGGGDTGGGDTGGGDTGGGDTGGGDTGGGDTGGDDTGGIDIPTSCGAPQSNDSVGNSCYGTPPPAIRLETVATGVVAPTFITQAPGDPSRLYVLEQRGTVRVIKDGELSPDNFLDLRTLSGSAAVQDSASVPGYSERGLLGMAFHPDFQNNGLFYINYTKSSGNADTSIVEMQISSPDQADTSSMREIVTVSQVDNFIGNHNGGMLAFGPDGCLYTGMGDGGGMGDPEDNGQDTSSMLAAMLRIDVDNFPTAAPGNVSGGNPHIWSYGLRNPWRFSFDRATGDMYIGDVGQNAWEEINVEPAGAGGRNYGWNTMEASSCFSSGSCDKSGITLPVHEYPTTSGANSVIGGYVYRGSAMPEMVGRYIWADWTERRIRTFTYEGESDGQGQICDQHDTGVTVPEKVRSFGQDLAGEIYIVASPDLAEGTVYKIVPE